MNSLIWELEVAFIDVALGEATENPTGDNRKIQLEGNLLIKQVCLLRNICNIRFVL